MTNWLESMQQTFEYYIVDPVTWKDTRKIDTALSSSITRDMTTETLGSATIQVTESLGECYIRIYLITVQNGIRERHPLGTFIIQTPSYSFDGKVTTVSLDAYTPLLELKESPPPIGYSLLKNERIMERAYRLIREQARAPVSKIDDTTELQFNFVANTNDTWLTFLIDLISNAKYKLQLDELGQILFEPIQATESLQPVWVYNDDEISILYPDLDLDRDLYGIPNVVEVVYSDGTQYYYGEAVNDDPDSPISTISRGRRIVHRVINPENLGTPTKLQVQDYAKRLLKSLSSLEYTITYKHGYCPVRVGDCVLINYERAGLKAVKARVIRQTISCEPGCPVTETAVFTNSLWR